MSPRRTDIGSVLVIGSGPIVIGQAAEFDYSGTQACRVLRAEGLRVILVNSNPATIMTDPEVADATYVEPITPEFVEKIIAKERPDALLPTLGGQTALNTAVSLAENGVLEKYNVELIGANIAAIQAGEDREKLKRIVDTGGCNIQFAVNPDDGRIIVIEMNPRVSRSSALASKATGFPIAKIAARLAVGYTLDEIPNDITKETPASFEPALDYVVVKVPRWAFEKFPGVADVLGTRMQSVGEAMALGRTFPESLQKALRSLEHGRWGLNCDPAEAMLDSLADDELVRRAAVATPDRPFQLEAAIRRGIDVDRLHEATRVDPWFVDQISRI